MEMENTEETQDSEKLVSANIVSKVQNGGVARHAKGQCD